MVKEQISLEKIANKGMLFSINEMSDKETDLSKKIPMWVQSYIAKTRGEETAETVYETLRRDPLEVTPLISQAKTEHEKNLIEEVKKDPYTVINATNQNYTMGLASQFFGNQNYKTLKEAIEKNGNVKAAFSPVFEGDSLLQYMVANATPEAVKAAASGHLQRATQREIIKNLCNEKGEFDAEKTSTYLENNIKGQKPATQNELYKSLGLAYMQTIASQQK